MTDQPEPPPEVFVKPSARQPSSLSPAYVVWLEDELNDHRTRLHIAETEVRRNPPLASTIAALERAHAADLSAADARAAEIRAAAAAEMAELRSQVATQVAVFERRLAAMKTSTRYYDESSFGGPDMEALVASEDRS